MFTRYFLPFSLLAIVTATLAATEATANNILPGSSLYASNLNQTWSSPNKTFFIGFSQVHPSTSSSSSSSSSSSTFVASIFYIGGIPVWIAGGVSDAVVDSGGAFHFLRNGSLQLVNGFGTVLWDSNTANLGVSYASLDDSGELTLRNSTVVVWSSFRNPIDTIVPSQNFTENQILRSGPYSFRLLSSGNLTLTWNDSIVYLNDRLVSNSSNLTNPTLFLQPNGILSLSDSSMNREVTVAYGNDYGEGSDVFRFIRLDSNGNLRMYSANGGSGSASSQWALMADQCQVYGYCGDMGVCSYIDSTPVCGCPSENFVPLDANDGRKGCRRKLELEHCAGNATMLELKTTEFLTFQAEEMFIVGITACRSNCLESSSCVASSSLSDGTGYCYMKTPGLVSGYSSPVVPSTSYVKVCGAAEPNPSHLMQSGGKEKHWLLAVWVIGGAIVGLLLFLIALVGCTWWWYSKNRTNAGGIWRQYTLLEYASGAPVQFSFKELHRSTKGFKEKIGDGGFGVVYRGVLANGMVVAVKQLEGIQQGERQFRMEVATISGTHHLNLVRLIGFCSEGRHRLLVFEFMKNGSLNHLLFAAEAHSGKSLNWDDRLKIALGTAKGITYLHEECRDCIVHCDIKPENILLDDHYNAKVSDFGLAKLINPKDNRYRSMTNIRGTRGYLAPEWLANLQITSKSDVYSFGMVLLEIVSGRRNFEVSAETNHRKFSEWAYEEFEKSNVAALIDKSLSIRAKKMEQVMRAIQVSFWCIQEHPSVRPTMGKVVQMLEGIVEITRPPPPKVMFGGFSDETSISGNTDLSSCTTVGSSAPIASSSSSFQTASVITSTSGRKNMEIASSSLLESHRRES